MGLSPSHFPFSLTLDFQSFKRVTDLVSFVSSFYDLLVLLRYCNRPFLLSAAAVDQERKPLPQAMRITPDNNRSQSIAPIYRRLPPAETSERRNETDNKRPITPVPPNLVLALALAAAAGLLVPVQASMARHLGAMSSGGLYSMPRPGLTGCQPPPAGTFFV